VLIASHTCIVCDSSDKFDPTLEILARCRACGFVTWLGTPSDDLTKLYNEEYFTAVDYPDYVGNATSLRRSMNRHLDQMSPYLAERGAVLEIGCAYGFFLDEAKKRFERVVGIDIAEAAVDYARTHFKVDAVSGAFLDVRFDDGSFDAICLWDTIEHLDRPDLFLEKARRLLRPGGKLFLTTGDISSRNARIRGSKWRQIHPPSHLHYFSRNSMTTLLKRVGFRVMGIETAAYYHTLRNILASIHLRGGLTGRISGVALAAIGEPLARRVGLWIDLGDIMFVAAALGDPTRPD
jgi:SAM-dependent methyltransferase